MLYWYCDKVIIVNSFGRDNCVVKLRHRASPHHEYVVNVALCIIILMLSDVDPSEQKPNLLFLFGNFMKLRWDLRLFMHLVQTCGLWRRADERHNEILLKCVVFHRPSGSRFWDHWLNQVTVCSLSVIWCQMFEMTFYFNTPLTETSLRSHVLWHKIVHSIVNVTVVRKKTLESFAHFKRCLSCRY